MLTRRSSAAAPSSARNGFEDVFAGGSCGPLYIVRTETALTSMQKSTLT